MSTVTEFAPGSLVKARDRSWVVQPGSDERLLLLAPTGGADNEVVGILRQLEDVQPDTFAWPDVDDLGSHRTARLLRDAVRAGFRSTAGPFRSLAQVAVDPRPYQLVPLMMALKLDPVRLLVADDVGIGKTIEAAMIAKELLVTGRARRLTVVCPRHLVEQWIQELADKFHLEATAILPSTAGRLERRLMGTTESLFERHPVTVVSTDFIKSEQRRYEFARVAPDLVIVDEAHICSHDPNTRSTRHHRHQLLKILAESAPLEGGRRHLLLVTATPHSGKDGAFRSLLTVLNPTLERLADSDEQLTQTDRDVIAQHFVQRKRADIRRYLGVDTKLPIREALPGDAGGYRLTTAYRTLVDEVQRWARTALSEATDRQTRIAREWTIIGLLRALGSSPAAAEATLRSRAATAEDAAVTDELRNAVVDADEVDAGDEAADEVAGTALSETDPQVGRLLALADRARALRGPDGDRKLAHVTTLLKRLLKDGYNPIVFCRFIDTAVYVGEHLRDALPGTVAVDAVHGRIPADARPDRVDALGENDKRVLVATNCLSEGINLQALFQAVVHYDLPWSPTRLEQREGRVDRFGQPRDVIRVATIYGRNLLIEQSVMQTLLAKHQRIKSELGVSIPVPASSAEVMATLFDKLLDDRAVQLDLTGEIEDSIEQLNLADAVRPQFDEWDRAAERESRTRYAQRALHPDEVQAVLEEIREALGDPDDLPAFLHDAITALGGTVQPHDDGAVTLGLAGLPSELRDALAVAINPALACPDELRVTYDAASVPPGVTLLTRTAPVVAAVAAHLVDAAIDRHTDSPAARAGVLLTRDVNRVTYMLLARHRHDLITTRGDGRHSMLVEEAATYAGQLADDGTITWLDEADVPALLAAEPAGTAPPPVQHHHLSQALERRPAIQSHLDDQAIERAIRAEAQHRSVRTAAGGGLGRLDFDTHPADLLGLYVLVPGGTP